MIENYTFIGRWFDITTNYEKDESLRELANEIINTKSKELWHIKDIIGLDNIGFVRVYNNSNKYGECRKITGIYAAFIPYKFIITFYDKNTNLLSENQKKLLMYHELKHIGEDEKLINHDVEDFADVLKKYGIGWEKPGEEIPDVFKEGD